MAESPRIAELQQKFEANPRRYFASLANEYRKSGDLPRAISICRVYLERQPLHTAGHVVLGQSLFQSGQKVEAEESFHAVLGLDPENLIALRGLGELAQERGTLAAAQEYFGRILATDPQNDVSDRLKDVDLAAQTQSAASLDGHVHDRTAEYDLSHLQSASEADIEFSALEMESEAEALSSEGETGEGPGEFADPDAPPPIDPLRTGEYSLSRDTSAWSLDSTETEAYVPEEAAAESRAADTNLEEARVELAGPFITETVAELYLQQGFTGEALLVYRQLAHVKPDDHRIAGRIAELELRLSDEHSARQAAFEAEDSEIGAAPELSEMLTDTETQSLWEPERTEEAPEPDGLHEAWEPAEEPMPAPPQTPQPEPDDWFGDAATHPARARQTVREFFAVLGRARPAVPVRSQKQNRITADEIRAAVDIVSGFGAFGITPQGSFPRPIQGSQSGVGDPQEDVKRFRAWLDGLSDS